MPTAFAVSVPTAGEGWRIDSVVVRPGSVADQGSTTVTVGGSPVLITRGHGQVPARLARLGWRHVGDPGSTGSIVVDAYQGPRTATTKLFTLTLPSGRRYLYVHRLTPGESYHNSFAAVSPDGRWLVSGGWGTQRRLYVFAMPTPSGSAATVHALPLATTIRLTHPVRNVQGCAFTTATELVCATNDPRTDLFPVPRQLLSVRLLSALSDRAAVSGAPALLASAPMQTLCTSGAGEVEGIDYFSGRITVSVNSPCSAQTQVFTLSRSSAAPRRPDVDVSTLWSVGAGAVPSALIRPADPATE